MEKPENSPFEYLLVLRTVQKGGLIQVGSVTVWADTTNEAIQGLKDILSHRIDLSKLPKSGLDLRKKRAPKKISDT